MATPRVSVLMPVFKPHARYLREAVDSVRAQTLGDWELVVVEDPPATAGALLNSYGDTRIRHHVRGVRASLADALNDGLSLCRAEYVARLDGDDICAPDRLEKQLAYLESHPATAVVGSSQTIIDEEGRVIGRRRSPLTANDVARAMRRYNCIAHPAVMFRRDAILAAGGYMSGVKPEDYDLWCRLLKRGDGIENLPEDLLRYRYHAGALKFDAVHDVIRLTVATKERYFGDEFTIGDRLRIVAEKALLLLPASLVLRLFRILTYGRAR